MLPTKKNVILIRISPCSFKGGVPFSTTRWQCVPRQKSVRQALSHVSPPPILFSFFSQFLTVFSRRWSSINTHQVGIYQEDFVLWSEANNYQIWWKTEHILRLYVISLPLFCRPRVCACTCINTFKGFVSHRSMHTVRPGLSVFLSFIW